MDLVLLETWVWFGIIRMSNYDTLPYLRNAELGAVVHLSGIIQAR